jgi:hypothetical protein
MVQILTEIVNAVPWWIRLSLALICIALGALALWFVSFRLGLILIIAGLVFLMFSGRSDSEKNGYNF